MKEEKRNEKNRRKMKLRKTKKRKGNYVTKERQRPRKNQITKDATLNETTQNACHTPNLAANTKAKLLIVYRPQLHKSSILRYIFF